MSIQIKITPRSADEVIASMGNIAKNTQVLIEVLSRERWTAYELSLLISENPKYDTFGKTGDELAERLYGTLIAIKTYHGTEVLDSIKKEWFAPGTLADPQVQKAATDEELLKPIVVPGQMRRRGERSLRDIIFEILNKKGPLEQRQIVFEIKRHPDYQNTYSDHMALRKAVNGTLRNNSAKGKNILELFERHDDGSLSSKWGIKMGAIPPPIRVKAQTQALTTILSSGGRTKAWSIPELASLVFGADSGYRLSPNATLETVLKNIQQRMSRNKGILFEKINTNQGARWQLMRQRTKITLKDRLTAIDLIADNRGIGEVVEALTSKHPAMAWNEIRRLYDPPGAYSISRLTGTSREAIESAKAKLTALHNSSVSRMRKIHEDPELISRRLEGIARRNYDLKLDRIEKLHDQGIDVISKSRAGWIQVGHTTTPEHITMLEERDMVIAAALDSLSPLERRVIELVFFDDSLDPSELNEESRSALESAMEALANNEQLQEIA